MEVWKEKGERNKEGDKAHLIGEGGTWGRYPGCAKLKRAQSFGGKKGGRNGGEGIGCSVGFSKKRENTQSSKEGEE